MPEGSDILKAYIQGMEKGLRKRIQRREYAKPKIEERLRLPEVQCLQMISIWSRDDAFPLALVAAIGWMHIVTYADRQAMRVANMMREEDA